MNTLANGLSRTPEYKKSYNKAYHQQNRKTIIARVRKWEKANPKDRKEYQAKWRATNIDKRWEQRNRQLQKREELRRTVVAHLGDKCCRCGFSDHRALQIDHINGGGHKDRKSMCERAFLAKVLTAPSGEFQILCANCNWIKRLQNQEQRRWERP